MTVHKSQGSEFDAVTVVLPDEPTENEQRLLTREMLYTAVTRARSTVHVHAGEAVLRRTVARRTERASGLRARLWGAEFDDEGPAALEGDARDADADAGSGGESA
jgi:exodeoxyribonuclease V alpha subunit